jgi:hypothetical protein
MRRETMEPKLRWTRTMGLALGMLLPTLAISCGPATVGDEQDQGEERTAAGGFFDSLFGGKSDGVRGSLCLEDDYPRFVDRGAFEIPLNDMNLGCNAGVQIKMWVHSGDAVVISGVGADGQSSLRVASVGKALSGELPAAGHVFSGDAAEGTYLMNWVAKARYHGCNGKVTSVEPASRQNPVVRFRRADILERGKICVNIEATAVSCDDSLLGREKDANRKNLCDAATAEGYLVSEATLQEQCQNSTMDVFTVCCD